MIVSYGRTSTLTTRNFKNPQLINTKLGKTDYVDGSRYVPKIISISQANVPLHEGEI